jgi:hypothetical protein
LPVNNWQERYAEFFSNAAALGHRPTRITLGTYREMGPSLLTFSEKWGLPLVEFELLKLIKDGMHYHLPAERRIHIYSKIKAMIEKAWKGTGHMPVVALCKEPRNVRRAVGLDHNQCNCG